MCDLAVASDAARFALPGVNIGVFCSTPAVGVSRNIGRKRAAEMAYTGDVISAQQALDWGLVNDVVPDDQPDKAFHELLARATRGSRASKALGKATLHQQITLPQDDAYRLATQVMADSSKSPAATEAMAAFLDKRAPRWVD
jgi:enoyl-CoA hydratase/carnithine racemase